MEESQPVDLKGIPLNEKGTGVSRKIEDYLTKEEMEKHSELEQKQLYSKRRAAAYHRFIRRKPKVKVAPIAQGEDITLPEETDSELMEKIPKGTQTSLVQQYAQPVAMIPSDIQSSKVKKYIPEALSEGSDGFYVMKMTKSGPMLMGLYKFKK